MDGIYRQYLARGEAEGERYLLASPRRPPMGIAGMRLGNRSGSSVEFRDHREYEPGDDPRHIDWSAFARTDRLSVKLYQEEVSLHLDLVLDVSRSMDLEETGKAGGALVLSALLAQAASNASMTRAIWTAGDAFSRIPNGSERPAAWEGIRFDSGRNIGETLAAGPPVFRPRGIRIVVADFLWLGDPLSVLTRLSDRAAAVVLVEVLSRADIHPELMGNLRLVDSESGEARDVFFDAGTSLRYRDRLLRHEEAWRRAARQTGAVMARLVAEDLLEHGDVGPLIASEVLGVV
jgi:uncharacterized protein (DUF58 family)